ncbi:hypothetical protein J2I47_21130 [Fibrella sp. HMF5335]|uniref:Uncharacterized protein n=1 Tax=Fibrella rubiginis TaxID=2817060 RepID=A0A939K766_9BACT|nr:hypothetical protein [Fibrella rubiginis]MBO0939071.1 hypothetical protein [Fibrella rubiginis]
MNPSPTYSNGYAGEHTDHLLPNNPFVDEVILEAFEPAYEEVGYEQSQSFSIEPESPFISEFESNGDSRTAPNPMAEQMVSLLAELHDHEMNEALFELATEFEDVAMSRVVNEAGGGYSLRTVSELRNHAAPLIYELETMIGKMADEAETTDLASKSEAELEQFFDKYLTEHEGFSPRFELFFGKVFRAVKSVARRAVDAARKVGSTVVNVVKKGVEFAGKFLPIGTLLNQLKKLVMPLVNKVINFAINKIPAPLQPVARQFVNKLMNRESFETQSTYELENYTDESEGEQSTTYEINEIQQEFNARVANLLFSANEQENEVTVQQYVQENEQPQQEDEADTLALAREQFVRELSELKDGEDPTPAIQRFLPAILPVLRIALRIIGRDKVVNFLGGLVSQLIGKLLGNTLKQYHGALGNAVADIGLKLLTLETPGQTQETVSYEAYASTVEEILTEIGSKPENYTADSETVQNLVAEAFERAAANNFPTGMVKPTLRQVSVKGMWMRMPRSRGAQKTYRKFSHPFPVTIAPRVAHLIKTFKGQSLASFLKDKLGLPINQPIKATVHVYEAIHLTKLPLIARAEKLPGLNSSHWSAYCQFHPLTVEAASLLLHEPLLGKDVDAKFLQSRSRISTGQRFYFLEVPGARVQIPLGAGHVVRPQLPSSPGSIMPSPKVQMPIPRSSDAQAVLNFLKSDIHFNFFFSNEDARIIGQKLAGGDYLSAAGTVREVVRDILTNTLLRNVPSKVKIIHEAVPELYLENFEPAQEQFLGGVGRAIGGAVVKYGKAALTKLVEKLIEKFAEVVRNAVVTYLRNRKQEFISAATHQDGVTVKVSFTNVPVMAKIRLIINAMKGKASLGDLTDFTLPSLPSPAIIIVGGRRFD